MAKRLFIGIPISEEVRKEVKEFDVQILETGADVKLVSLENVHFTLKFLGDVEADLILRIIQVLDSILGGKKSFPITLQGIKVFPNYQRMSSIWIATESKEMLLLMKEINSTLRFIRDEGREEIPHLTVARVKSARNKTKLQQFLEKNKGKEFGSMIVQKVILYESVLTPQGPIYFVVKEFVLG